MLKTSIPKLHYVGYLLEKRGNEAGLRKLGIKHLRKSLETINVPWDNAEDAENDQNCWKALAAHYALHRA